MMWSEALERYATAQRAAGKARGTVRVHRHYLSNLAAAHRVGPWEVNTEDLRVFLSAEHWAPETRKSARSSVRGFYRWAYASGLVESDPSDVLEAVRVPPAMPRPTPEAALAEAVRGADDRTVFMLMLAAYAGLRCCEIARVRSDDYVGGELLVHGKGGKVRAIPIVHPGLQVRLRAVRGWAFPNPITGAPLTPGHVSKLLAGALPGQWTGHTLRHRMGTQAYAGTRDLLAVGALLGHTRPETTQRYVRLPEDAVRAAALAAVS